MQFTAQTTKEGCIIAGRSPLCGRSRLSSRLNPHPAFLEHETITGLPRGTLVLSLKDHHLMSCCKPSSSDRLYGMLSSEVIRVIYATSFIWNWQMLAGGERIHGKNNRESEENWLNNNLCCTEHNGGRKRLGVHMHSWLDCLCNESIISKP